MYNTFLSRIGSPYRLRILVRFFLRSVYLFLLKVIYTVILERFEVFFIESHTIPYTSRGFEGGS